MIVNGLEAAELNKYFSHHSLPSLFTLQI